MYVNVYYSNSLCPRILNLQNKDYIGNSLNPNAWGDSASTFFSQLSSMEKGILSSQILWLLIIHYQV